MKLRLWLRSMKRADCRGKSSACSEDWWSARWINIVAWCVVDPDQLQGQ